MIARITIMQTPDGNVILTGEGDFDFDTNKDSLVAKASIAAVDAASVIIDEAGGFSDPVLAGDAEALKMSKIKGARRLPPAAPPSGGMTFLDGTTS